MAIMMNSTVIHLDHENFKAGRARLRVGFKILSDCPPTVLWEGGTIGYEDARSWIDTAPLVLPLVDPGGRQPAGGGKNAHTFYMC